MFTSKNRRLGRLTVAFVVLLGALLTISQAVSAKSYSLDRLTVRSRVERDGSLWIDETRTYTFDGSYSWADFRLPLDRVGSVSEFSLSEGDRVFQPRLSGEPGTYVLESSPSEMYVKWHFTAEDETRSFRLRYRILSRPPRLFGQPPSRRLSPQQERLPAPWPSTMP